jgi:hypothetical protein
LSRQDLLRESRSWRYSRRKILRPDEFSGLIHSRDGDWQTTLLIDITSASLIIIGLREKVFDVIEAEFCVDRGSRGPLAAVTHSRTVLCGLGLR